MLFLLCELPGRNAEHQAGRKPSLDNQFRYGFKNTCVLFKGVNSYLVFYSVIGVSLTATSPSDGATRYLLLCPDVAAAGDEIALQRDNVFHLLGSSLSPQSWLLRGNGCRLLSCLGLEMLVNRSCQICLLSALHAVWYKYIWQTYGSQSGTLILVTQGTSGVSGVTLPLCQCKRDENQFIGTTKPVKGPEGQSVTRLPATKGETRI